MAETVKHNCVLLTVGTQRGTPVKSVGLTTAMSIEASSMSKRRS